MTKCVHTKLSNWSRVQCKSPATVNRDGKDYCSRHDPERNEVAKGHKDARTMFAVTLRDGHRDKQSLSVIKALVVPHGKSYKVVSSVEQNPEAYGAGEEKTWQLALGGQIVERERFAPTLAEAFEKCLGVSAKLVEDARVKADEETIRHEEARELVSAMKVQLDVP